MLRQVAMDAFRSGALSSMCNQRGAVIAVVAEAYIAASARDYGAMAFAREVREKVACATNFEDPKGFQVLRWGQLLIQRTLLEFNAKARTATKGTGTCTTTSARSA